MKQFTRLARSSRRMPRRRAASAAMLVLAAAATAVSMFASSATAAKPPIKIFWNSPTTAASAQLIFPMDVQVATSFVDALNAKGGVNGQKIDLITCNDQSDPNQTAACARTAVQDGVVAAAGFTYDGDQLVPILNAAGIPWIPTTAGSTSENTLPNSWPVTASYQAVVGQGLLTAKYCKKPVMVSAEFSGAAFILGLTNVGITAGGGTPMTNAQYIQYPSSTTDFGPIVASAMSSHPDCLLEPISESAGIGIATALKAAGDHPALIGADGTAITSATINAAPTVTNGAYLYGDTGDTHMKVWNDYRGAIAKYSSAKSLNYTGLQPAASWIAMLVVRDVLKEIKGAITAKSFTAAIKKTSNASLDGKAPPINFTKPWNPPGLSTFPRYFVHTLSFWHVAHNVVQPLFGGKFVNVDPAFYGKKVALP